MLNSDNVVNRAESCTVAAVRRVAALLDLDPDRFVEGQALPRGWHFILLGADTPRSGLRPDGFPGLGVPMADLGLPRLLLGGRTVEYHRDILVGESVRRVSGVKNVTRKVTGSGPMAIVTIGHELCVGDHPDAAINETQTYLLLAGENRWKQSQQENKPVAASRQKTVAPDETLLFQYSALGFNSHKIHIDKSYARDVEGYPDLVVNGGLTTLLLSEFARADLGLVVRTFTTKHVAPLFCGRPMTLAGEPSGDDWTLAAYDEAGQMAVEMMVQIR
jgi:3-methylfumaryl-CoA hydratase